MKFSLPATLMLCDNQIILNTDNTETRQLITGERLQELIRLQAKIDNPDPIPGFPRTRSERIMQSKAYKMLKIHGPMKIKSDSQD